MTIAALASDYLIWWAAQVIAVAILIALVLRWKPGFLKGKTIGGSVTGALDARETQIQHQLEAAERSREEAARIREEARQDIEEARTEAQQIVTRAVSTSQAIQQEMTVRAQQEYERIVGQAAEQIDYERRQAEAALRRRAADIVVDAAGQIVRQNLSAESDRRIIDESLANLRNGQ